MQELLGKCIHAIEAEIALIEKEGGEQSYELLSGQREEKSTGALYVFLLADALRLPEDASGSLRVGGKDISAMVVSQEGNRVWLLLEAAEELPEYLPSAKLVVNETELLKKLKEKIEELSLSGQFGLGAKVFGEERASVFFKQPPELDERVEGHTKEALAQCLGSEVTFVWGPPGTGKTFIIAALVACLAKLGESVLVTSHTHAAVEQALWALVEPPAAGRKSGYLHGSDLIEDGKILKVGVPKSDKIPAKVCLDNYVEEKARERAENIITLEGESQRVGARVAELTEQLGPWETLREAQSTYERAANSVREAHALSVQAARARDAVRSELRIAEEALDRASRSFLIGRSGRVEKATRELARVERRIQATDAEAGGAEAQLLRRRAALGDARARTIQARQATVGLAPARELETEIQRHADRLEELRREIQALKASSDDDAKELVRNAVAIFATLTKLYRDRNLINDLTWDTVVIDEASMAMPPLVAYAASRAAKRVVIVGDMYQLPPVVRSDPDSEGGLLGTDIFELRGVTDAVDRGQRFDQLAKLTVQRRMHPDIAAVSRKLIEGYRDLEDALELAERPSPDLIGALGTKAPLVAVDISKFNPWSGKMPGSLSRFNFVSGQVAVEVASIYAAEVPKPKEEDPPRIGIITPYAAQRRFLSRLIQALKLERWVTAGTVHTFQGNECDVIIFDSVLGEPHWTARFTNPATLKEVRRDLNVAVTRARHQLVFVGDARWLKKNAKPTSGYGKLWGFLEQKAEQLDGSDVVGDGFRARVAKSLSEIRGWDVSQAGKAALLTEKDFYPVFTGDLMAAKERAILYTPFIGKTRWPQVEPYITLLRDRNIEVFLLHKPLSDPEWRRGDLEFGRTVFRTLAKHGVRLVPMSGVHAKTIVIDGHIVYEGSLNWASQVASYEHMWRFESKDMALLIEKMLQIEPIVDAFSGGKAEAQCPNCHGPLVVVNQREKQNRTFGRPDLQPVKLGCLNHEDEPTLCQAGYLRRVDGRAPFLNPPVCPRGARMKINFTQAGRPWDWRCGHAGCRHIRWAKGDCLR